MSRRSSALHADWLTLVEPSGPFLTLPVLKRAFPDGLERTPLELRAELRERVENLGRELGARQDFVRWVLRDLLGFADRVLEAQGIPISCTADVREHGVHLRPDFVVWDPGCGGEGTARPRLLVSVYPFGTPLTAHLKGEAWAASPADRMVVLCRATGCELGIVTEGDRFEFVRAPVDGPVGRATWVAGIFTEGAEASLLDSFTTLFGARRFFASAPENRLEALLVESSGAQTEVSGRLGGQVRRATELLVAALSRTNLEAGGTLLAGIEPHAVYEAVATVMMRLVFLLYAEERRLLPLGDALYDDSYAASTLLDRLSEDANRMGEEALEHRASAWPRLLGLFRAVYGGLSHDALRIPAYGGRLFDPDRFPFLEGRSSDTSWRTTSADPPRVDDRTILGVLRALQVLEERLGGATEARRLAFRALDVEQIGHVYESLLDHSAVSIERTTVGLIGRPSEEPEVALSELERKAAGGSDALVEYLAETTGKTPKQLKKLLAAEVEIERARLVRAASDNDETLAKRILPFANVVRDDLRGLPIVLKRGTLYVTSTSHRRDTGTEYTPRELADEIVHYALEPLVYQPGAAEGVKPSDWKLKKAEEILKLRVCDPAVGSGAFLVAACRYLADRLVEAWTREGNPIVDDCAGRAAPDGDVDDITVEARRRVAERCLYGVDRDPMAVEMAKLSLWLTTLSRERPFSFLDHALQCGDSLLGITDIDQVRACHIKPAEAKQRRLLGDIAPVVTRALELRKRVMTTPVVTVRDAEEKRRLLAEADALLRGVKVVADLVIGAALVTAGESGEQFETKIAAVVGPAAEALEVGISADERARLIAALEVTAYDWLNRGRPEAAPVRHCLHWPLAFPEVFSDGGQFDRVVGNPPFLGGQRLTGRVGEDVREYLIEYIANGARGSADLVAYFFLRAAQIARGFGLLATNTISQGDTRAVGLDQLKYGGWTLARAVKSIPWPGDATLEVAKVWMMRDAWRDEVVLDGRLVYAITTSLDPESRVLGQPHRLVENKGKSFQGTIILGLGFTMSPPAAAALINSAARNRDVLSPYLNGEDVNSSPTHDASRWIVNFFDWPESRARQYPECFSIVERTIKPERAKVKDAAARRWWQYLRPRTDLYATVAAFSRVLVITLVSKVVLPVFVPTGQVFAHLLGVFAYDDDFHFGVLSSAFHWHWAVKYASTLETRIRYTPSDVFETFPQPPYDAAIESAGRALDEYRRQLMVDNNEGLTATYNRVHDPEETDSRMLEMRRLHRELDLAVRDAYGWSDLDLNHGIHDTPQGLRYTIGPEARIEVLDRLLELNHERYKVEVAKGLHAKGKKKGNTASKGRGARTTRSTSGGSLFDD